MGSSAYKNEYGRRYVNGRETMAYVLFKSSLSFNIDEYKTRFIIESLKIDLDLNSVISLINGIWDVVNDSIMGYLIDRTSTRYGKFRPYLFFYASFGMVFTCLYWTAPLFFDKNPFSVSKFFFWLLLAMTQETIVTAREIAETGLISSITPNPDDRVRMFTSAEVIAAIWENIPPVLIGILIDLVNHKKISATMDTVFTAMGTVCAVVSGVLAIFLSVYSRERILAKPNDRHNYADGLRALMNNKPLLLMMISDFTGFTGGAEAGWEHNYYIDVLGSNSLRNLVTIPGAPLSFVSYTYINKIRGIFPTKALWIFGQHLKHVLTLGIFIIGSMRGSGPDGLYRKIGVMLPLLMTRDIFYKSTLSVNKIIPKEITLDALDYGEWKNGFRAEGIILATKSMIMKLVRNVLGAFTTSIMKHTGYSIDADFGQQSYRAQYSLFVLCMAVPGIMGILGSIPKFFYDLSGEKKQRMYEELAAMRAVKNQEYDEQTVEIIHT